MTEKKSDQTAQKFLKEQELDKIAGGRDEVPARQENDTKPKKNWFEPDWLWYSSDKR